MILLMILLCGSVYAGDSPTQSESYEAYWENLMRAQGVAKDTIQMFLEAQDCAPIDTIREFEGTIVPHVRYRRIGPTGKRGYLCECISRKKVSENGVEYWEYVIKMRKVFDITDKPKK